MNNILDESQYEKLYERFLNLYDKESNTFEEIQEMKELSRQLDEYDYNRSLNEV